MSQNNGPTLYCVLMFAKERYRKSYPDKEPHVLDKNGMSPFAFWAKIETVWFGNLEEARHKQQKLRASAYSTDYPLMPKEMFLARRVEAEVFGDNRWADPVWLTYDRR